MNENDPEAPETEPAEAETVAEAEVASDGMPARKPFGENPGDVPPRHAGHRRVPEAPAQSTGNAPPAEHHDAEPEWSGDTTKKQE